MFLLPEIFDERVVSWAKEWLVGGRVVVGEKGVLVGGKGGWWGVKIRFFLSSMTAIRC